MSEWKKPIDLGEHNLAVAFAMCMFLQLEENSACFEEDKAVLKKEYERIFKAYDEEILEHEQEVCDKLWEYCTWDDIHVDWFKECVYHSNHNNLAVEIADPYILDELYVPYIDIYEPLNQEDKNHLADIWYIQNYNWFLTDEGKQNIQAAKERVHKRKEAEREKDYEKMYKEDER
jgi:hypothetical protein